MEVPVSRLADMDLAAAALIGLDDPIGEAGLSDPDGAGWFVVVTEEDGAVAAALSADDLTGLPGSAPVRQALPVSRATVIVHPDCTVVAAISSWAVAEAGTWAVAEAGRSVAMVVRRGAEVTGVWAGADLDEVLEIGTTRSGVDLTIPGEIKYIPEIVRMCAFEANGIRCDAVRSFAERPSRPQPCDNLRQMPEHQFDW
jgi:hypothetical protein